MVVISFRIPFKVLGTTQYVNGSAIYHEHLKKGRVISVVDKAYVSGYSGVIQAEVIDTRESKKGPDDFKWRVF